VEGPEKPSSPGIYTKTERRIGRDRCDKLATVVVTHDNMSQFNTEVGADCDL